MVRHRLRIDGMTCTGCEAIIRRHIGDIGDVELLDIDHEAGTVELTTASVTTGGYVEQAINDLGYEVVEYDSSR